MKKYDDLTDEQLLELATLAHDQPASPMLSVDHTIAFNRIVNGEDGVCVFFNCLNGTITRTRRGQVQVIYNIFQIVDKCRQWGVSYDS